MVICSPTKVTDDRERKRFGADDRLVVRESVLRLFPTRLRGVCVSDSRCLRF